MKADIKVLEQKVKASINLDTERDDHRETKLDREIEQDLDQQSEQCYEAGDNTSLSIGGELHNRANFEQVGSAFVAQGYENGNIGLEGDKILASSNRGYARLNHMPSFYTVISSKAALSQTSKPAEPRELG